MKLSRCLLLVMLIITLAPAGVAKGGDLQSIRIGLVSLGVSPISVRPIGAFTVESCEERIVMLGADFYSLDFGDYPTADEAMARLRLIRGSLPARLSPRDGRICPQGNSFSVRLGAFNGRDAAQSASQSFSPDARPNVIAVRREWRPLEGLDCVPGQELTLAVGPRVLDMVLRRGDFPAVGTNLPLRIIPQDSGPGGGTVRLNGALYPGSVEIRRPAGGPSLSIVNHVVLESCVAGVLQGEIYASWPPEALKAQAVVARTNTLAWAGRHGTDFDLCDSSHCQVYKGSCTDSRMNAAVNETAGEVLKYNGRIITAFFHASSGGRTENNEDVWPGAERSPAAPIPYLRAVDDPDESSPYFRWNTPKAYSLDDFARVLGVAGDGPLQVTPVYGSNGVVVRYMFARDGATLTLAREDIRGCLDLPSPRMEFAILTPDGVAQALRKTSLDGPVVLSGVSRGEGGYILDVRLKLLAAAQPIIRPAQVSSGCFIIVDGRGHGHGIGMSQWGAKSMAESGQSYQSILSHYYRGVELVRIQ